jgi:hypothetical protein
MLDEERTGDVHNRMKYLERYDERRCNLIRHLERRTTRSPSSHTISRAEKRQCILCLAYSKLDYNISLPHKPTIPRLPGSIMSHLHIKAAEELWDEFVDFCQSNLRKEWH